MDISTFQTLNSVNVNEHTERKKTGGTELTYLSWAWAWAEVKKYYEKVTYEVKKFGGLPYVYDYKTGYMVYTSVTIDDITHEMWLPVMDGANMAMKAEPYEVTYPNGRKRPVAAATMMDINKTIMRCLTKNLAMFGLGLYIYAGEDIPEGEEQPEPVKQQPEEKSITGKITEKQQWAIINIVKTKGIRMEQINDIIHQRTGKAVPMSDLTVEEASALIKELNATAKNN